MRYFLMYMFLFMSNITAVNAYDIPVEWDANTSAEYYIVYWGTESCNYSNHSPNTTETRYIIENVPDGVPYYIAVKAFNSCGNGSVYSDELVSVPTCAKPTIKETSCLIKTTQTEGD